MNTENKIDIEQIANRANELTGSMNHGYACYAAVREFLIPREDESLFASLVSAELINRENNPRRETPAELKRKADINALIPKHLEIIAAEIEAESAVRGGNWGLAAVRSIRRGSPRWQQTFLARERATSEVDATTATN